MNNLSKAKMAINKISHFKEGDKVKIIAPCSGTKKGKIIILKKDQFGTIAAWGKTSTRYNHCSCPERWQLIKKA